MTLYDDLGVGIGADRAELRRAYRDQARRVHPDTRSGDAQAADAAMARLNHAWGVLGDVQRRAEYDARMGLTAGSPPAGDAGIAPDEPVDELMAPRSRLWHPAPWVLLGVLMLIIFVATAYAGPHQDPPPPDVTGMCLEAQPGLDRFVTCGPGFPGRVVSVSSAPTACPVGSVAHLVQSAQHFNVCLTQDASQGR